MKQTRKGGFSLLEIVVAISILAVLGGVLVPQVIGYIQRGRVQSVVEDFKAIETAMTQYFADVGTYSPLNDIGGFTTNQNGKTFKHFIKGDGQHGWDGPYMQRIKVESAFGGQYDIDVIDTDSATIDLGTKSQLGPHYDELLERINEVFDGDNKLNKGVVWGDANGIHYGQNYYKN